MDIVKGIPGKILEQAQFQKIETIGWALITSLSLGVFCTALWFTRSKNQWISWPAVGFSVLQISMTSLHLSKKL